MLEWLIAGQLQNVEDGGKYVQVFVYFFGLFSEGGLDVLYGADLAGVCQILQLDYLPALVYLTRPALNSQPLQLCLNRLDFGLFLGHLFS